MAGCDPSSADAGGQTPNNSATPANDTTTDAPVYTTWPIDMKTGRLRQITKYVNAVEADPSLVLISDLPNSHMPPWDIDPIGVSMASAQQVEALIDSRRWALIDVRKDRDILEKGTIPGAYHFEYKFQGATYDGQTRLTRDRIDALLEEYDGVVLFCNGPKCPRSFNSCLYVVQNLGVPGSRVRWFRTGVPSWTRSPLIPVANQITSHPDTTHRTEKLQQ